MSEPARHLKGIQKVKRREAEKNDKTEHSDRAISQDDVRPAEARSWSTAEESAELSSI